MSEILASSQLWLICLLLGRPINTKIVFYSFFRRVRKSSSSLNKPSIGQHKRRETSSFRTYTENLVNKNKTKHQTIGTENIKALALITGNETTFRSTAIHQVALRFSVWP